MVLKSISVSKLENAEVVMLAKSAVQTMQKHPKDGKGQVIHELAPGLLNQINTLEERLGSKVSTGDSIAPADADLARDREYASFSEFITGLQHYKEPVKAAAAQKLIAALKSHPVNVYDPYDKESLDLTGLIDELAKEEYQAALTTLDGMENYQALALSQKTFVDSQNEKIVQKSSLNTPIVADVIRRIRIKLTNLFNVIVALEESAPAQYASIVSEINSVITEYHAKLQSRKTRKDNQDVTQPADTAAVL